MAFDNLNRSQRRAVAAYAREAAAKRPACLTQMSRDRIIETYPNLAHAPTNVWESRKYLVQLFDEQCFQRIDTRRMTVSRVTLGDDGHWEENLQWEELQDIKREIGFGDWYGVEIFPRDRDVVNVANMRHIWLLAVPLSIGWFRSTPGKGDGQ